MQDQRPAALSSRILQVMPEDLKLVTDKNQTLYDKRVDAPFDENMVMNIMVYGILEPVIVRQNGSDIEVIAGRNRVKAAIEANIRLKREGRECIRVPIILRKGSEAELYGILVAENEIRHADSAVNKGEKMRKLKNLGQSTAQIAQTFGMTRQNVENMLIIDDLAQSVKDAIAGGEITSAAALEIRSLSEDDQKAVLEYLHVSGEKPTVAGIKRIVEGKLYKTVGDSVGKVKTAPKPKYKVPPKKHLEKRLELIKTKGFGSDRYLQAKPVDFQSGFEYALKWILGHEQESEDFAVEDT